MKATPIDAMQLIASVPMPTVKTNMSGKGGHRQVAGCGAVRVVLLGIAVCSPGSKHDVADMVGCSPSWAGCVLRKLYSCGLVVRGTQRRHPHGPMTHVYSVDWHAMRRASADGAISRSRASTATRDSGTAAGP
jgi:hypothetical protein